MRRWAALSWLLSGMLVAGCSATQDAKTPPGDPDPVSTANPVSTTDPVSATQDGAQDATAKTAGVFKTEVPATQENLHQAIRRGFDFLVAKQNPDGAWGSHNPVVVNSAQLGFGMINPGCHDGVRTACTAICAKALLNYPDLREQDQAALDKAIAHNLKYTRLAYDPGNAFNCWGYAFNLDFLLTLYAHPRGEKYKPKIREAIADIIAGIRKMQAAEGGWAYYTSVMMEGSSISFTTASMLLGLLKARDLGFEIPEGMIRDAGEIVKVQMLPNRNFIYGKYLEYAADHHLEDLGAGGRTQICGLSVHRYDGSFTREHLQGRSNDYFRNVDYVEVIGNKRIIPHRDAPHNISGYFFYYGCYYSAEVMTELGKQAARADWEHLAKMILRNQEPEGCWWDTMCFDYGDKWGTGFALQCLEQYLAATQGAAG